MSGGSAIRAGSVDPASSSRVVIPTPLATMDVDGDPAARWWRATGPSSRPGSNERAARQAWTKVCWAASSANSRLPSARWATLYTSRPYSRYTARTASGSPSRNRAMVSASTATNVGALSDARPRSNVVCIPANRSSELVVPMRNHPQQRNNDMKLRMSFFGLLAAAAIGTAACGASNDTATPPGDISTPAAAPVGSNVAVKVADSPMGKILISTSGTTLYGFANDTAAKSTCYGACANAWPPVIVDDSWAVGPGLDSGVFSTITRDDGTQQLVAGKFPALRIRGRRAHPVTSTAKAVVTCGSSSEPTPSSSPRRHQRIRDRETNGTDREASPGPGSGPSPPIGEARRFATRQDHGRRRRPHVVRVHEGRQRRADVR